MRLLLLPILRRPAVSCLRRTATSTTSTSISISTSSLRTFTSLLPSSRRPTIPSTTTQLLPSSLTSQQQQQPSLQPTAAAAILLPLLQTRGHRRKTYNPSHRVRKRRFGFLARLRSKTGKNIIKRRREKGRKMLTH